MQTLLEGGQGALITRQANGIVPIPFAELMDPETGRTRIRMVDTETDSFRSALALQSRVTQADLDDPARLSAIAAAANLTPELARTRYAPLR